MLFSCKEHQDFYHTKTAELKADVYLRSLIYTLGICPDTRRRFNDIYNTKAREIDLTQIQQGWQTAGSLKVTRLAFQLFTDGTPTARYTGPNQDEDDFEECQRYSVSDIFACGYAPYFIQAVNIRYPEYFTSADYV